MKLDIKTIVDLRGPAEYNKGAGERRLDSIYKQHIAKIPKFSGNFEMQSYSSLSHLLVNVSWCKSPANVRYLRKTFVHDGIYS